MSFNNVTWLFPYNFQSLSNEDLSDLEVDKSYPSLLHSHQSTLLSLYDDRVRIHFRSAVFEASCVG